MIKKYDIIIVGAGIAGIAAALHLKRLQPTLKLLILEKFKFPRNKLCAGYLTEKSRELLLELGLDIPTINYQLVTGLTMNYQYIEKIKVQNHGLYCHEMVDRQALDYALFKLLKNEQVTILENTYPFDLNQDKKELKTSMQQSFTYNYLIFADGEAGYSAKFNQAQQKYFTMQMNIKNHHQPQIAMHLGIFKKGYAWCANSGHYLNLGFCDIYQEKTDYFAIFKEYVKTLGYEKYYNEQNIKGFFVPYGLKKNIIINEHIYLVGDAAGLVDPLTLAGISYAILSGKYVALSITEQNNKIYGRYLKKVKIKYFVLKLFFRILYNPLLSKIIFNVIFKLFGKLFSWLLDHFILNKSGSFHE